MRRRTLPILVLIGALSPVSVRAQAGAIDSIFTACAAKDTSTAWLAMTQRWSLDTGKWIDDSLRGALIALGQADQATRDAPGIGDSIRDPGFVRRMNQGDSANAAALMAIVRRYGWPTRRLVGAAASHMAFLIAQHNPAIQHEALRLMQTAPSGEVSPTDVAMLEDRVRVSDSLPQRYGTQLSMTGTGPARFAPIEDPEHLDARRARAGLPPLAVYMCMMRGYTGREIINPRSGKP